MLTPDALALAYDDPATDSRTPKFFIRVDPGVIFTSGSKIAKHGEENGRQEPGGLREGKMAISHLHVLMASAAFAAMGSTAFAEDGRHHKTATVIDGKPSGWQYVAFGDASNRVFPEHRKEGLQGSVPRPTP